MYFLSGKMTIVTTEYSDFLAGSVQYEGYKTSTWYN